jgi:cbb3-type cytochrome oxidase cytochrome c subunit
MRRLLLLALLVPLASGCGWGSFLLGSRGTSPVHTGKAIRVYPTAPKRQVPRWVDVEHLPPKAIRGAALFESAGCLVCHTYAGSGSRNLNAPDLTSIGSRHLGIKFQIAHLKCPACAKPGSPMPPFRSLGRKRLRELAIFLEASKGIR